MQWQNRRRGFCRLDTGEIYAFETGPDGRVIGVCGPLQEPLGPLQGYALRSHPKLIDWFDSRKRELLSVQLLE
jgi:hypothetical protein